MTGVLNERFAVATVSNQQDSYHASDSNLKH
jgi:hypothetical protein